MFNHLYVFLDFSRSYRIKVWLNQTVLTSDINGENDFQAVTTPPM